MSLPIIMHVNYCEQGQSISEMCRKAVAWGFDGIEFRRVRTGVEETPGEYLDAVARAAEEAGLGQVLFGGPGFDLMTEDAAVRKAQVEEGLRFYKLAAERVALTVCNTMAGSLRNPDKRVPYSEYDRQGSGAATEDHYLWAAEGFRELGALAEALGFKLAFEIHMGYLHDLPEPAIRLIQKIGSPAVGANLDYGNMVYFPAPPSLARTISTLGDRTFMVHLKNSVAAGGARFPVGLGDGVINHREYLRLLMERGFDGPICIEAPRPGDREWFAQQDIGYLKSVLNDLACSPAPSPGRV